MSKSKDPNKVGLGEVFALITSNKALCWVVVLITALIIAVLCGIAYHNQQKTIKKHELLKDSGVLILATSYREYCGKNATRFYRFDVNKGTSNLLECLVVNLWAILSKCII